MTQEYTKTALLDFTHRYLEALVKRDPAGLPVSPDLKATENGEPLVLGEGLWKTARAITTRKTIVDQETGQAAFFGVVIEKEDKKAIFVLRLKIGSFQITEIETLVAREGCHALFFPDNLASHPIMDMIVPKTEQSPRDRLIAIGNSYFEGIEQNDASIVPLHPDCNRWENGFRTTNNPPQLPRSAAAGFPRFGYIEQVSERRYPIVDEDRGIVLGIVRFDVPGETQGDGAVNASIENTLRTQRRSLFLYELFKIENGLIRHIEAFMSNVPFKTSMGWTA